MIRSSLVIVTLIAGLSAGSPVSAQETGTLIKRPAAQVDKRGPAGARTTMEAFGACLVSRSRGRVLKFVDMPVDQPAYRKYLNGLFAEEDDQCLSGGDLRFNDVVLRGALFQALYESEFRADRALDFAAVASSGYRDLYGAEPSPAARSSIALVRFGECVARADPANLRALLFSLPGSPTEATLMNTLVPRFGACIPKGENIVFSKVVLKGALAEGMYRLSSAAATKRLGGQ